MLLCRRVGILCIQVFAVWSNGCTILLQRKALGDFIGTLIKLFVDDGGLAGDNFEMMLGNTRRLLQQISETRLSLSATKSKFFMTEATFAGGRVGPNGIKPDLTKLTAITDWRIPKDLQNLGSFLGLTGHFRSLIKGYVTIAQPLTDLTHNLELPKQREGSICPCYERIFVSRSVEKRT